VSWKNVIISNPSKLTFSLNSLNIEQSPYDESITIALSNINSIILDHPQITLTAVLLSECAENNINIISTNKKHMPSGMFTSYSSHSRATEFSTLLINLRASSKNNLWKNIIRKKILLQSRVLKCYGLENADKMLSLLSFVNSGDKRNIEAYASSIYWKSLFIDFKRFADNKHNMLLNYGYSILRSLISKEIVGSGFYPAIGIKHCNIYNNFNLADDLIEPYRPIVDNMVITLLGRVMVEGNNLTKSDKEEIFSIYNTKVISSGKTYNLQDFIKEMLKSLQRFVKDPKHESLLLPDKYIYE